MGEREYRVLLLEDDALVLERVRDRLHRVRHEAAGDHWHLSIRPVRACMEKQEQRYVFTRQTLDEVAEVAIGGVDLIVLDFGFIHPDARDEVRALARAGGRAKPSKDDVRGRILTTEDLAAALRSYVNDVTVDDAFRAAVRTRILDPQKRVDVILYSYTSEEFFEVFQTLDARRNRTAAAFPKFTVMALDTKAELYNRTEFDWPNLSKHDPDYYSFLVSGLLVLVIRDRFFRYLLETAEAPQYLRVKRTARAVAVITITGMAFGISGEWIGSRVFSFVVACKWAEAAAFAVFGIIVAMGLGLTLPRLFETMMASLLRPPDDL